MWLAYYTNSLVASELVRCVLLGMQIRGFNEDRVSILYYLKKIYPNEFSNFLERLGISSLDQAFEMDDGLPLRLWCSYRGQTLARTVRGVMYYEVGRATP